ncbi:MAG: NAD(P)H-dependent oxidoreductase [Methanomicrobiales archaeon]
MKIVIACYSWKGHTRTIAKELAKKLNAAYIDIEPLGDISPLSEGIKALFGLKSAIKPPMADMKNFDHLVIATPVWSHNLPPFTRQYLSELNNCEGKQFSVLVEMGGSGADGVIGKVKKILDIKEMEFVASAVTIEKDVDSNNVDPILQGLAEKIRGTQKNE